MRRSDARLNKQSKVDTSKMSPRYHSYIIAICTVWLTPLMAGLMAQNIIDAACSQKGREEFLFGTAGPTYPYPERPLHRLTYGCTICLTAPHRLNYTPALFRLLYCTVSLTTMRAKWLYNQPFITS